MDIVKLAGGELLSSTLHVWPDGVGGYDASFLPPNRPDVHREGRVKAKALEPDRAVARLLNFQGSTELRQASPVELFRKGLRDLVRRLRTMDPEAERLRMAVPALSNAASRQDYWHTLRDTAQKSTARPFQPLFLTEPDAVLQYFRLVRREVDAPHGMFQAYLIIDAGAGTTNIAVVFKPKTRSSTAAERGRHAGPLEPVAADAPMHAGYWVDQQLIAALLAEARKQVSAKDLSDEVLRRELAEGIETAKIEVSRTRQPLPIPLTAVGGRPLEVMLTTRDLTDVAHRLWDNVAGDLRKVLGRTFIQLSEAARYRSELEERGIQTAEQVPRLFRYVILAGGTSRLPGFQKALLGQLPGFTGEVLAVGDDYPYAVAAGLAAHALEVQRTAEQDEPPLVIEPSIGAKPPPGPDAPPRAPEPRSDSQAEPTDPPEVAPEESPSENVGVARLIGDVELVYRREGQEKTWGKPLFEADRFPWGYAEEAAGTQWKLPQPDRKKERPPALLFGLAYARAGRPSERESWARDDMLVQGGGVDPYWERLEANRLPDKVRVCTRFDEQLNAMVADILDLEGKKLVRLRGYIDAPPRRVRPLRTAPPKPPNLAAPSATPTPAAVQPVPETARESARSPDWDLCLDIGTSKIVVVRASPGWRLHGAKVAIARTILDPDANASPPPELEPLGTAPASGDAPASHPAAVPAELLAPQRATVATADPVPETDTHAIAAASVGRHLARPRAAHRGLGGRRGRHSLRRCARPPSSPGAREPSTARRR